MDKITLLFNSDMFNNLYIPLLIVIGISIVIIIMTIVLINKIVKGSKI